MTTPKVSTRTAVNLITNGDFSEGASGWVTNTGGSVRVEDGLLLLSEGEYDSATQTVKGLSADENYKLTFSYRVLANDKNSYLTVNGLIIDRMWDIAHNEELIKSFDHVLTRLTEAQFVFVTESRAVAIDDVVFEHVVANVSQLTVSAESVEHNQTIYCTLQAYSPTGELLINTPVTWTKSGSIRMTSSSTTTDAQGNAFCVVAQDTALPGQEGQGHIVVDINGTQKLTSPFLTFKREV